MFKKLFTKLLLIRYMFVRAEHVKLLKEQNEKLKDTVVQSMDLVTNYKHGLIEMREQMNAFVQMQMHFSEQEEVNIGEEENVKQHELIRRKITIH